MHRKMTVTDLNHHESATKYLDINTNSCVDPCPSDSVATTDDSGSSPSSCPRRKRPTDLLAHLSHRNQGLHYLSIPLQRRRNLYLDGGENLVAAHFSSLFGQPLLTTCSAQSSSRSSNFAFLKLGNQCVQECGEYYTQYSTSLGAFVGSTQQPWDPAADECRPCSEHFPNSILCQDFIQGGIRYQQVRTCQPGFGFYIHDRSQCFAECPTGTYSSGDVDSELGGIKKQYKS